MAPGEGMGQGAAIDLAEFPTQGHAMGDAGDLDLMPGGQVGDVVRGGDPLHGGTDGEDDLAQAPLAQALLQGRQAQFRRAHAIQGREPPTQHEIEPAKSGGLLDGDDLRGALHHAEQGLVAIGVAAQGTQVALAQGPAATDSG